MTNLLQKPPPLNRMIERPYSTLKPASACSDTPQITTMFKVVLNSPELDASSDHHSTDHPVELP